MSGNEQNPQSEAVPETSPIPGLDLQSFKNYVMRALAGDLTVPPAILNLAKASQRGGENDPLARDRDWWQDLLWQLGIIQNLDAIERLINRYNEMADWHHDMAERARRSMRNAGDKLHAINEFILGVDEIGTAKTGGGFDREKAIRLLKMRGLEVKPNEDEDTLAARLFRERERAKEERSTWSNEYDDSRNDAERHDAMERESRSRALELVQRRDAIRTGGYDAQEESLRLRKLTEEYDLDVRLKTAALEKDKSPEGENPDAAVQRITAQSQEAQAGSQASDFMKEADELTAKLTPATPTLANTGNPRSNTGPGSSG